MSGALTHEEIEALDCSLTAGLEPKPGTVLRMMATIRHLERELVVQAQRTSEAMQSDAAAMERMGERVRALEGHLGAVVTERLQGDNRAPQPALQAALRFLNPGPIRREHVVAKVEELGGSASMGRRG